MLEQLKEEVCRENLRLMSSGLVVLTWGNVSGYDQDTHLVVIKPSGVKYDTMKPSDMVIVDLDGKIVEGSLKPSSDTLTHLEIYKSFAGVNGIAHTHSVEAVAFAQAMREIPCYGTTHADHFYGTIPCTRTLTEQEVDEAYEFYTGRVIVERFANTQSLLHPGVLVAGHGPFTWGATPSKAVDNAIALEAIAHMARLTEQLAGTRQPPRVPSYMAEKHFQRKHGSHAYYGQN